MAMLLGTGLRASAVAYDFSTIHTSSGTPGGSAPYARLTVTQDGAGKVDFKFEALDLAATEFISYLKFNVAGAANNPSFTVSDKVKTGSFDLPEFSFKKEEKNDAGLGFDVFVSFETSSSNGGAKRFTDGDIFEWSLSRAGFTVADIDLPAMIHLQGIAGGKSAKITASLLHPNDTTHPLPDGGHALMLLGLGLLVFRALPRKAF